MLAFYNGQVVLWGGEGGGGMRGGALSGCVIHCGEARALCQERESTGRVVN